MTTQPISSVPADVADFVSQVRAALADLPPDDVDELTAGLAADLADARAESPEGWSEGVGSPEAYAAELRSAAGLPPAGLAADPGALDGLRRWWASLATHPVMGRVQREGHDLAPAWWVIRGGIGGLLIGEWFFGWTWLSLLTFIFVALGAAVSVRLGRHVRSDAGPGWRVVSAACTALAILVGLLMATNYAYTRTYSYEPGPYVPTELMNGGESVTELYGFDGAGQRVEGLRLFDQAGRPLKVSTYEGYEADTFPRSWEPSRSADDMAYDEGLRWTPPMTLPAVPGASSAKTSTSTSSTSSSSSLASTTKGEKSEPSPKATPSPRSTTSTD